MAETGDIEKQDESWKAKALVGGVVLGALVGLGAAYLLLQRAERENQKLHMSAGEGVKLGVMVFGLLRQVAQLGEKN